LKYGEPVGIEALKIVRSGISIPVYAIGGIESGNIGVILASGADGVALISAIIGAKEPKKAAEEIIRSIP
jgi:thiamine-phosphate pyrophosphorylase